MQVAYSSPSGSLSIHVMSCSEEHEVIGTGLLANATVLKRFEHIVVLGPYADALSPRYRAAIGELKATHTLIMLFWNAKPCLVKTAMIHSSRSLVLLSHIPVIL